MNISSILVHASENKIDAINAEIEAIDGCEIPLIENAKMIVLIEAPDIGAETQLLKQIENIDGVISAKMVFAYSEEELDAERKKIELADNFPKWLNEENIEANKIPYNGRLKM